MGVNGAFGNEDERCGWGCGLGALWLWWFRVNGFCRIDGEMDVCRCCLRHDHDRGRLLGGTRGPCRRCAAFGDVLITITRPEDSIKVGNGEWRMVDREIDRSDEVMRLRRMSCPHG